MKKFLLFFVFALFCFPLLSAKGAEGEILTFPANSKAGFEWGYVLYLPKNIDTSKKLPILFTMNNSGPASSIEEMEKNTLEEVNYNRSVYIFPDALKVPMLMPLVIRPEKGNLDPHNFNRVAFLSQDPKYKRIDLQVLAMVKDARKQLKKRGIKTYKKILIAGYSAAGSFGEHLTFLHPDKVLAAATCGHIYSTFPLKEKDGIALFFPIGAYDVKQVTGKDFDEKNWLKVPVLHTIGNLDYNDPMPWEVMIPEERKLILDVYGYGKTAIERWEHARNILKETAPNIQAHSYPNLEHEPVVEDMIKFLEVHKNGGPLKPIKLTDTSDRPAPLPIHITDLYWGKEAPITGAREHLGDNDLILKASPKPPFWIYQLYLLDITYNGKTIIKDMEMGSRFNDHGQVYLQEYFSDEEIKLLKSKKGAKFGVKARIAPKLSDPRWKVPELIIIPEDLTFSVK